MSDQIWYREELEAIRAMIEDTIRRADVSNFWHMAALGRMHSKVEAQMATAPSLRTPEAAA
jgi:hypothetical protein